MFLAEEFETAMTSKGQVMIFKPIRKKLGLAEGQRFIESTVDNKVILEPVPSLVSMGGILKELGKKKNAKQLAAEAKEGWE